jgi:subtilisin family serine protease
MSSYSYKKTSYLSLVLVVGWLIFANQTVLAADYQAAGLYKSALSPTDSYYGNQWYLQKIKAPIAWDERRESPDIVIAIIDSGVQINHPDLKDNIWRNQLEIPDNDKDDDGNGFIDDINGWDFVNNMADPNPKFTAGFTEDGLFHGTIVAGVAAASGNNAAGIAGVTWQAQLMPLKALDDQGTGDTFRIIQAIDYAVNNGADIINLSFVGYGYNQSLAEAIERAYRAGVIVVAAAGNEESGGYGHSLDKLPIYPACHDGNKNMVIGVASTDALDQKTNFSSYGSRCVDISAPGVSVYSTVVYAPQQQINGQLLDQYYDGYWSGTSVSVPMVSGALALLMQQNPSLQRDELIKVLLNNTDDITLLNTKYLGQLGSGRLNVASAVNDASLQLSSQVSRLLVAPAASSSQPIRILNNAGRVLGEFYAFGINFPYGLKVASGDLDNDGSPEIVVVPAQGGQSAVKIFNYQGKLVGQFIAWSKDLTAGLSVAVGNVDKDKAGEIIVATGSGVSNEVRVFTAQGVLKYKFQPYNAGFRGGVNLALGDTDGDGATEIITGAGPGGGPHVRIFSGTGHVEGQFMAYETGFRGGVQMVAGNFDYGAKANQDEIIVAPGAGRQPQIRVFNAKGRLITSFVAFNNNFQKGFSVSLSDIDGNGLPEIVAAAGPGGGPHVRIFDMVGNLRESWYVYSQSFAGGVNASALNLNKRYFN